MVLRSLEVILIYSDMDTVSSHISNLFYIQDELLFLHSKYFQFMLKLEAFFKVNKTTYSFPASLPKWKMKIALSRGSL
jgi:hypothetical protein